MNRLFRAAALAALMATSACGPQEAAETVDDTVGVAREALYSEVPAKLLAAPGGNRVDLEVYGARLYFPIDQTAYRLSNAGGTPAEILSGCQAPGFIDDLTTDGSHVAYVCKGSSIWYTWSIRVHDLATGTRSVVDSGTFAYFTENRRGCGGVTSVSYPRFLPRDLSMDSLYVYFHDESHVWRVRRDGSGDPQRLTPEQLNIRTMVRSGSTLFFTTHNALYRVSTAGSGYQLLYFNVNANPELGPLTVINGYVYFSEWNNVMKRVPIAGGSATTVLAAESGRYIKTITAVPVASSITVVYLDTACGGGTHRVRKLPAGGSPTTIETLSYSLYPDNLRADTSYVYWWDAAGIKRDLLNSDPVVAQ
jgi:hypothetical protein